jgi:hypothetical protein
MKKTSIQLVEINQHTLTRWYAQICSIRNILKRSWTRSLTFFLQGTTVVRKRGKQLCWSKGCRKYRRTFTSCSPTHSIPATCTSQCNPAHLSQKYGWTSCCSTTADSATTANFPTTAKTVRLCSVCTIHLRNSFSTSILYCNKSTQQHP